MKRIVLLIFFLFILIAFTQMSFACSMSTPAFRIQCDVVSGETEEFIFPFQRSYDATFFSEVRSTTRNCVQDFSSFVSAYPAVSASWSDEEENLWKPFNVFLEPYSQEREIELNASIHTYDKNCYYDEYLVFGDWIMTRGAVRDYCRVDRMETMQWRCGTQYKVSWLRYWLFNLRND